MKPWVKPAATAVVGLVSGVVVGALLPRQKPHFANPSWADTLIDNIVIIWAIRVAGAALAVYVVASVVARVLRQEWLSGGGSFTVGEKEKVDDIAKNRDQLLQDVQVLLAANETLEHQLASYLDPADPPSDTSGEGETTWPTSPPPVQPPVPAGLPPQAGP